MSSGIYKIILNNKDYIGSAKDIKDRIRRHLEDLNKNKHGNKKLQHEFNKYGIELFDYVVLEEVCIADLIKKEQQYLDNYKPYYNICTTAGSSLGRRHSEETIKHFSETRKGKQPSLGRKLSDESKNKMSIKAKERGMNPVFMAASKKANIGRKQTKEEILKRSFTQMKLREEDAETIKCRLIAGDKQVDLAREYGVSQTVISRAKTGKGVYSNFMKQPKIEDMVVEQREQIDLFK